MMKINESGRSMIEMLGVLAIIGVLSVGGIAGYSKAMMKYRENKTIDQISHAAANTRILFSSQKTYEDLDDEVIERAKLFNTEMGNATDGFTNPFAGSATMKPAGRFSNTGFGEDGSSADSKAFVIIYDGIPEEACIDLATIDWGTGSGGGLVAMGVNRDVSNIVATDSNGNDAEGATGNVVVGGEAVMSVAAAVSACKPGSSNTLYFKFY